MHEFSLATEVINLVKEEARKNRATAVTELTIEVGNLSGVEANAFQSALGLLSEGSVIEKTAVNIIRTKALGKCMACNIEFEMEGRIDLCPACHSFPSEISGGKEFRVISLLIEQEREADQKEV